MSPSSVLAMTMLASPDQSSRSAMTSSTCRVIAPPRPGAPAHPRVAGQPAPPRALRSLLLHLPGLLLHVLDAAHHIERRLRKVVVLAFGDRLERCDRLFQLRADARLTGELLGDVHPLGHGP